MSKKDIHSKFDAPAIEAAPLPPPPAVGSGKVAVSSLSDLVSKLEALRTGNPVLNHQAACDLLLAHINSGDVTAAFNAIPRNV